MERVSFDIEREEVAEALHAEAAAHGRSVEQEALALVEKGLAGKVKPIKSAAGDNWIRELVQLAKDLDLEDGFDGLIPPRMPEDFEPPRL